MAWVTPRVAPTGKWVPLYLFAFLAMSSFSLAPLVFRKSKPIDAFLVLQLVFFGLSAGQSVWLQKSLVYFLALVSVVIVLTRLTRNIPPAAWSRMWWLLTAFILGNAIYSYRGYTAGRVGFSRMGDRLAGLVNTNSIAMVLMVGFIVSLQFTLSSSKKSQWFYLGCTGFLSYVLYLTASRSSLSGAIAGASVLLILQGRLRTSLLWLTLALSIGGVVLLTQLSTPEGRETFREEMDTRFIRGGANEDILDSRRSMWDFCIARWKERPVLGWGFSVTDQFSILPVDGSGYHGMLASVGTLGALGFGGTVLGLLLSLQSYRKMTSQHPKVARTDDPRFVACLGFGLVFAFLVQGVGEPWQIGIGSFSTFTFYTGIGMVLSGMAWMELQGGGHGAGGMGRGAGGGGRRVWGMGTGSGGRY